MQRTRTLQPHRRRPGLVRAATLCLVNRERTSRGVSALHARRGRCSRPRRPLRGHGLRRLLRTRRPPRRHAAVAHARRRLHLQLAPRLRRRREHRLGDAVAGFAQGHRRRLDGLAGTPREHPRRDLQGHRHRRLAAPARVARARPVRRDLHAGLRSHHQALEPPARRRTRPLPDNLRRSTPNNDKEQDSYGSTRRQVGDRHRLGTRDRTGDRGAARLAGRAVPHQRPRRRRRRAGLHRRSPARRPSTPAT